MNFYATNNKGMMIINDEQEALLTREIELLRDFRVSLIKAEADEEDVTLLHEIIHDLKGLFMIVIVGEFNSGKSSLLNALLGNDYLDVGVTPTTSRITLLRYGKEKRIEQEEHQGETYDIVHLPVDFLRGTNLVDTPGTNAVMREHQASTEHFIPKSDLVLFLLSSDRPLSESELAFIRQLKSWDKTIVFVLSKTDMFDRADDSKKVMDFLKKELKAVSDDEFQIFPISSKYAIKSRDTSASPGDRQKWREISKFDELEAFMKDSLDPKRRAILKMENPVGVALKLVEKYKANANQNLQVLKQDVHTIKSIERQLEGFAYDMKKDFSYQHARIDNVLLHMSDRGEEFFDEYLRLGRFVDLLSSEKIRGEFERKVIGQSATEIEQHSRDFIDWLVAKHQRTWGYVVETISQDASTKKFNGAVSYDSFEESRTNMLRSVRDETRVAIQTYDAEDQAKKLADSVRNALYQTAAVQASALGIGAVIIAASMFDITGLLGASALAATGLCILPYRRAVVKREFNAKVQTLRDSMKNIMQEHFETEMGNGIKKIEDNIAPYTRFVSSRERQLQATAKELHTFETKLNTLTQDIRKTFV